MQNIIRDFRGLMCFHRNEMTMRVTTLAKKITQSLPEIVWPHACANHVFDYEGTGRIEGDSMAIGAALHQHLETYINGGDVPPQDEEICSVIMDILIELGLEDVETESTVQCGKVRGIVDLHGTHKNGRKWVIEMKFTQGTHIEEPRPQELMQLALYACMLDLDAPLLACFRINLNVKKIGVYLTTQSAPFLDIAEQHLKSA